VAVLAGPLLADPIDAPAVMPIRIFKALHSYG
jgi:hypothetical protein